MLRFTCPYCSVNLTAGEDRAGKKVICPRCKGKILLSGVEEPPVPLVEAETELQLVEPSKPLNAALLDLPDKPPPAAETVDQSQLEEQLRASILHPAPEYTGERKLPWPIDILLYPISTPGLTVLGIVIVIPLVINLATGLLGIVGSLLWMPVLLINSVLGLYFLWYVTQCVVDSAQGGVRAPETLAQSPGLGDMVVQMGRIIACIAVALLPLMIYRYRSQAVDATYWSLLGFAVVVCPMGLLSAAMHDSIGGLNPFLLLISVARTLFSYLGLILVLGLMTFLMIKIRLAVADDFVLAFVVRNTEYYPILIAAHLLGRFYWRNRERLDWIV